MSVSEGGRVDEGRALGLDACESHRRAEGASMAASSASVNRPLFMYSR